MVITATCWNDVASPPGFDVSLPGTTIDTACTIVALRGELDAAALNTLVESFDDAIDADRLRHRRRPRGRRVHRRRMDRHPRPEPDPTRSTEP